MWCARCKADVAAEVTPDNQHVRCATCGNEIGSSLSNRTETRTRQARELLERWSQQRDEHAAEWSNPAVPENAPALAKSQQEADQPAVSEMEHKLPSYPTPEPHGESSWRVPFPGNPEQLTDDHLSAKPQFRVDAAERETSAALTPRAESASINAAVHPPIEQSPQPGATHTIHAPHFSLNGIGKSTAAASPDKKPTNWVSTVAHWLAYAGVLGLMVGTCLVILGYFRGPENYAPTGWLITMAGQMLLFLGVVTLVSSGMEETTSTVARHIDRLEEKLRRIEQATESLKAPHSLEQFRGEQSENEAARQSAENNVRYA